MLLAEFEIFHNRPYSPTRRIAVGRRDLPIDPPPGFGAVLLGAITAVAAEELSGEDRDALRRLMHRLEAGERTPQPQVRHRLQTDTHGLARTWAGLRGAGDACELDVEGDGSPLQLTLAAVYAAGQLPLATRPRVFDVLRRGLAWRGPIGPATYRHLSGDADLRWASTAFADPRLWALDVLGLHESASGPKEINRRFRQLLREAHPDHGAADAGAADRIADLTQARDILDRAGMSRRPGALLLAPGAGSDRNHPTSVAIEELVAPLPVARMDFPYRKAGRRAPDRTPVLLDAVVTEAADLVARARGRADRLLLGGRSMGGRMCSMAVADGLPAMGLVLLSYPLHPPGRPDKLRIEHLPAIAVPTLVVSGTKDPFGTPDELVAHLGTIGAPVTFVWVEGAGHEWKRRDRQVAEVVADWVRGRAVPERVVSQATRGGKVESRG